MEAQRVYIKTMRMSLRSSKDMSKRRLEELNSALGQLRQLLSCVVCCQLLMDPYKPKGRLCGHHVCRLCLRGRKRLLPSCSDCQDCFDFRTYEENKSMAVQLLCYKTLCVHLMQSSLYVQLVGHHPDLFHEVHRPRIRLPDKSTQWFIQEGARYDDMRDTFLTQPELPFPKNMPVSLPAETPPTTAATTPELPYEQHMPEQLSITDIELEAAATAEQAHFTHPLPMMTAAGARMLSHHSHHIAPQPQQQQHHHHQQQVIIPTEYIADPTWTEQVNLSGAFSNFTTYVMPSGSELHMPTIGQVVQIPQQELVQATLEPAALTEIVPTYKRRHADMLAEEMEQQQQEEEEEAAALRQMQQQQQQEEEAEALRQMQQQQQQESTPIRQVTYKRRHADILAEEMEQEQKQQQQEEEEAEALRQQLQQQEQESPSKRQASIRTTRLNPKPTIISSVQVKPPSASSPGPVAAAAPAPVVPKPVPVAVKAAIDVKPQAKAVSTPTSTKTVESPEQEVKTKDTRKTRICRCGTSRAPGPATCRNGRCVCYTAGFSCEGCKCIGCNNPHTYSGETTDEDEEEEDENMLDDLVESSPPATREPAEATPAAAAPVPEVEPEAAAMQTTYTLVPLDNLQQSQLPLVIVQNERGEYQCFNMFNGSEPLHPTLAGFKPVLLQNNDGNSSVPQYAYVMPQAFNPQPQQTQLSPAPSAPKKYKPSVADSVPTRVGSTSVDGLVSGGCRTKAAAGDSIDKADKAHSLFENIMSGSDDL